MSYKEIDEECPLCHLRAVWLCTMSACPKKDVQASTRKKWMDSATAPPPEEEEKK